jgi:hypothetical protein
MEARTLSANPSRRESFGRVVRRPVILALLALAAFSAAAYFWRAQRAAEVQLTVAQAQAVRAKQNFTASNLAIEAINDFLADSFARLAGSEPERIDTILAKVVSVIDKLAMKTENDPDVLRRQGSMYIQFSATYLALGNTALAVDTARKGTAIFRALAATQRDNNGVQSNVGLSLQSLAAALRASGDGNAALAADRESLAIARNLAGKEPGNKQFQTDVVLALWRLASAGDDPRDRLTEAIMILKHLKLAATLTSDQEKWIGTIEGELSALP